MKTFSPINEKYNSKLPATGIRPTVAPTAILVAVAAAELAALFVILDPKDLKFSLELPSVTLLLELSSRLLALLVSSNSGKILC